MICTVGIAVQINGVTCKTKYDYFRDNATTDSKNHDVCISRNA